MSYRVPVMEKFSYQDPIIAVANTPSSTTKGDRFIVGTSPADAFVGQAGKIAWYDGAAWKFDTPADGWYVYNKDTKNFYKFDGSIWDNKTETGNLDINGNITSDSQATIWQLIDNNAAALSFDTVGKTGMLVFDTTDDAEKVTIGADTQINGNLTVQGQLTYINSVNLEVTDKLFTVNKNGAADSGGGAGFQIEELGTDGTSITYPGYIKTNEGGINDKWLLKAPDGSVLTLDVNADSTIDISGNLTVEAASAINQDLTTDAAAVQFGGLTVTNAISGGSISITNDGSIGGTATIGTLSVTGNGTITGTLGVTGDTTLGNASLTGTLGVTGNSTFSTASFSGNATFSANLTDGTNNITIAQAVKAYDSRAQYDTTLGCIVFDDAKLDTI